MAGVVIILAKVELCNLLVAEVDIEAPIALARPDSHRLISEGLAHADGSVVIRDASGAVHAADVPAIVQHRRQRFWKGTRTGCITAGRWLKAQGLMGSLGVVHLPPAVEVHLTVLQAGRRTPGQQLCLQGAMQTFVLALGLRMTGGRPWLTWMPRRLSQAVSMV